MPNDYKDFTEMMKKKKMKQEQFNAQSKTAKSSPAMKMQDRKKRSKSSGKS